MEKRKINHFGKILQMIFKPVKNKENQILENKELREKDNAQKFSLLKRKDLNAI